MVQRSLLSYFGKPTAQKTQEGERNSKAESSKDITAEARSTNAVVAPQAEKQGQKRETSTSDEDTCGRSRLRKLKRIRYDDSTDDESGDEKQDSNRRQKKIKGTLRKYGTMFLLINGKQRLRF